MEKLIFLANENIVVSKNLKKRFGGTIIVHGADTKFFDPKNFDKNLIKEKLDLRKEYKYILFSGMPREHKGLEELIKAIKNVNYNHLKLVIVGGDTKNSYYQRLLSMGQEVIIPVGKKIINTCLSTYVHVILLFFLKERLFLLMLRFQQKFLKPWQWKNQ